MSAYQGHLPGGQGRNGMPDFAGYTYRGPGYDKLTPDATPSSLKADIEAHEGRPYEGYDSRFSPAPEGKGRKPGWNR